MNRVSPCEWCCMSYLRCCICSLAYYQLPKEKQKLFCASENFRCVTITVPSCDTKMFVLFIRTALWLKMSEFCVLTKNSIQVLPFCTWAIIQSQSVKAFIGFYVKLYTPLVDDNIFIQSIWRADYFCVFNLKITILSLLLTLMFFQITFCVLTLTA